MAIHSVVFVSKVIANVVTWVVHVVHLHILDHISAQTFTAVLEKLTF